MRTPTPLGIFVSPFPAILWIGTTWLAAHTLADPPGLAAWELRAPRPMASRQVEGADEIELLVQQLSSDNFDQRRMAARRLLEIGEPALPVLSRFRHEGDSEVSMQVLRLSRIIVRDRVNRQIQQFLNQSEASLPGWTMFEALYGDTTPLRQLFAKMYQQRSQTMGSAESPAEERVDELNDLLAEFKARRVNQVKSDDPLVAAIGFLLATFFVEPANTASTGATPPQVPVQLQLKLAEIFELTPIKGPNVRDATEQVIAQSIEKWVASPDENLNLTAARLRLARGRNLKAGLVPAVVCLEAEKHMASASHREAIDLIARFGDASHFELLEKYLDDATHVFRTTRVDEQGKRQTYETRIGDIALGALIHIADLSYEDFGFYLGPRGNRIDIIPYTLAGFRSDEQRQQAIARWRKFRDASDVP